MFNYFFLNPCVSSFQEMCRYWYIGFTVIQMFVQGDLNYSEKFLKKPQNAKNLIWIFWDSIIEENGETIVFLNPDISSFQKMCRYLGFANILIFHWSTFNKKAKSTLSRWRLCPNHLVTWALSYSRVSLYS